MNMVPFYLTTVFLIGCAQPCKYETDVFYGGKINHKNLQEIAKIDEDIIDFAKDLYAEDPEEISNSQVVIGAELELADRFNQDSNLSKHIDTKFLEVYCDSRGGDVFNWIIDKKYERLREGQVRKEFYTCEIDGVVAAAILYKIRSKGSLIKIDKHYMSTDEFEKCRKEYVQLETDDGKITIDKKSLYDPAQGSKCRTCSQVFFVDLPNKELDDIEKISIILGTEKHDAFIKNIGRNKRDGYDYDSFEKGIEHKEEIAVKIKGIKEYKFEDVLDSIIVIDGNEYGSFKEVDPYQRDKHNARVVPESLAFE